MQQLTNAQIDNFCKRAAGLPHEEQQGWIDIFGILDTIQIDFFHNLYNTGLRFNELQNFQRWNYNSEYEIICNTEKDSNNRTFEASQLSEYFVNCLASDLPPYDTCRYATTNIWLKRAFAPFTLFLEISTVTTHLFRHNLCKRLAASGFTTQQISDYIGEIDNKNTDGYINSKIYWP